MASAPKMKPGAGGGPIQNAKAQAKQKQSFGKGSASAQKYPPKKPGVSGDKRSGKAPPFGKKGK